MQHENYQEEAKRKLSKKRKNKNNKRLKKHKGSGSSEITYYFAWVGHVISEPQFQYYNVSPCHR